MKISKYPNDVNISAILNFYNFKRLLLKIKLYCDHILKFIEFYIQI